MIKKILKNNVTKNTIWIISEHIVQMILSLIVGSLSAKYLGPSNYGLLNYGTSIVLLFTSFSKLGLESIIIKEYINNKSENGRYVGTALLLRIISSVISIILIYLLILVLKPADKLIQLLTVLQSISLVFMSYEVIDYWFQANLKSKNVAIAKTVSYIVVSIYKILLLILNKSVVWFAFSTTLDYLIIFCILLILYKKNNGQKLEVSRTIGIALIKNSYHFIISSMMVTLYMQMDKIMIGNITNEKYVGLYSAATTICMLWGFIPEAIINSFRPVIYQEKEKNNDLYIKKLKILYCIIFWIGIFFCAFITIFSKYIILILYGNEYLLAKNTLSIAVWYTTFAYLGSARGIWIVCENKNKYSKRYVFIGTIINLILNAWLIPKYTINGAAIATLITQVIVALIAPLFYKETRISTKYILEGIFLKGVR